MQNKPLPRKPAGYERTPCRNGETRISFQRVSRSEEHTSELQSQSNLVCRLLLEKKKTVKAIITLMLYSLTESHIGWLTLIALTQNPNLSNILRDSLTIVVNTITIIKQPT